MPAATHKLSDSEQSILSAALRGMQNLYSKGEAAYDRYAPDLVKEGVHYFNSTPDPMPGPYDNMLKGAFALPAMLSNPKYLKMLESYSAPVKKLLNPTIESTIAKFGNRTGKLDPSVWLHGSQKNIEEFKRLGYNLDPNTTLGPHFGSSYEQARAFLSGPKPTLHVTNLRANNPALFPDEGRLRSILKDMYQSKGGATNQVKLDQNLMDEVGTEFIEKLMSRGNDAVVYGNMHEGIKGSPSAISFFPTKQVDIVGRPQMGEYGNLTDPNYAWLQDRFVEEPLLETVGRKGLHDYVYGLTTPAKEWWK